MAYNIHTLPNGIRVVHVPTTSEVCYCGLLINCGSRDELDDTEHGMAHFIEHTIFKGTMHRRAFHILSRLDEVGGELNAYTTKEETTVHAAFLRRDFERAAELIADMLFCSTFPERELTKEKEVIADEIASYKDTPSEMIFDEFEEQIFRGHALAHNILGSAESLATFDADAVRHFMHRCYNTDQMVLSVLGSMSWAQVVRTAEKYYGNIAANPRQYKRESIGQYQPTAVRRSRDTHQGHVVMGNIAPNAYDNQRVPMYMLSNLLGGPCMNSRLSLVLRERNGIAYNVETSYTPFTDTGLFTVYFGTDAANIERSLRIVRREMLRLCNDELSPAQLRKAKRQIIGQMRMSTDNGENQMLSIGRSVLLYGVADDIEESCRLIESVSAAEILSVARQVIDPGRLSSLIYC